jgi:hypothetical protein
MQVLPGFVWSQPLAISPNSGLIIGYGEVAPEPSAFALAVAGGVILILIGSRRKRA